MTTFKSDLSREHIILDYLCQMVYPKLGMDFTRINDRASQNLGIDGIISMNGRSLKVDVKAQSDYLNRDLPTLAFELAYQKDDKEHIGWLFDVHKQTDVYHYVSNIKLKENGAALNSPSDINSLDLYHIDRRTLIRRLEELKVDKASCDGTMGMMRQKHILRSHAAIIGTNIIWSQDKGERPF